MKKPVTYFILSIFSVLFSCQGNAQQDPASLNAEQWQADLDYLTRRINKSFAGFTPGTKAQFQSEAEKLRILIPEINTTQRIIEFAHLLAILHDGHTEISLTGSGSGFHRFPMTLYYFGNDLYVIGAEAREEEIVGSKIIRIDGKPVAEVFEKLKPYMNRDNDIEYITTAPYLMVIPEILNAIGITRSTTEATLTVTNESGKESEHVVKSISTAELSGMKFTRAYKTPPMYLEKPELDYWYRYLPGSKVMYLNIKSTFNQDGQIKLKGMISDAFAEIDKVNPDKIVIDLRLNRGGNYHNALSIVDELKKRPALNQQGKVFLVNGRLTFSAAAVTTIHVKEQTNAIVIGEVSRARPNWAENMESYTLPNSGLSFDCTDELKEHSEKLRGSDIIPVDVSIPRTFEAYKAGKDEVMEYIISH